MAGRCTWAPYCRLLENPYLEPKLRLQVRSYKTAERLSVAEHYKEAHKRHLDLAHKEEGLPLLRMQGVVPRSDNRAPADLPYKEPALEAELHMRQARRNWAVLDNCLASDERGTPRD